ncbi:MAG TPA: OsmC family protein [Acidimicrobiales bacterium]|jgi:putative redox protein|nr:OsmC family protein [Acidimicrobiales bacterium]
MTEDPSNQVEADGEQVLASAVVDSASGLGGEGRAGIHRLAVDEGKNIGGHDEGFNPFQLVLLGLAQCTTATLRLYADRKGWELGALRVRARLIQTGAGSTAQQRIERQVRVGADLDPEQRSRLAEIAERTPVTRMLRSGVAIDTTMV